MNTMSPSPMEAIKADIAKLDAAWRRADAAGNEAEKNALSATYNGLVEELEDAAADLESDHNLGEHGPGEENPDCPTCKAISKTEAAMVAAAEKAAWERIHRDVTEEYCFLCNRVTDHRGEHEPADFMNTEGEER